MLNSFLIVQTVSQIMVTGKTQIGIIEYYPGKVSSVSLRTINFRSGLCTALHTLRYTRIPRREMVENKYLA